MRSFCKCKSYSHFFSKNINIYAIFNDQSFNDTLTNDIVSFEQLGHDLFNQLTYSGSVFLIYMRVTNIGQNLLVLPSKHITFQFCVFVHCSQASFFYYIAIKLYFSYLRACVRVCSLISICITLISYLVGTSAMSRP